MIQPELLGPLRLLAEAYRLPAPSSDKPGEVVPVVAVRQVQAEVEAQLADGRFRVVAAGERFEMDLPAQTRPGDVVRIALPAALAGRSPPGPVPSAESRLSAAGRLVAQLAQDAPGGSGGKTPGAIGGSQPLLPDAPVRTEVVAATLRELIALSGLFYESHQAEWVAGARDTRDLLREPQAQLAKTADPASVVSKPSDSAATSESASSAQLSAGSAPEPGEARAAQAPPVHPDAAPIVQQQIRTLEARHIVWNGQIWPGQAMRWEIEDAGDGRAAPESPERKWQTSVDLHLPRLGAVRAVMTLAAGGVAVHLHAESGATDALFAEHVQELRQSLQDAGLSVSGIVRETHGKT